MWLSEQYFSPGRGLLGRAAPGVGDDGPPRGGWRVSLPLAEVTQPVDPPSPAAPEGPVLPVPQEPDAPAVPQERPAPVDPSPQVPEPAPPERELDPRADPPSTGEARARWRAVAVLPGGARAERAARAAPGDCGGRVAGRTSGPPPRCPADLWRYDSAVAGRAGEIDGARVLDRDGTPVGRVTVTCSNHGREFVIVAGGVWNGGRSLMLPAALLVRADPEDGTVAVACSRAEIAAAPRFEADRYQDIAYRVELESHYGARVPVPRRA